MLKQVDANSCLACSLLFIAEKIAGQKFSEEDEKQLYLDSFGGCRESFLLSHLLAFNGHFPGLDMCITVDSEPYGRYLERLCGGLIRVEKKPVTIELIRNEALNGAIIVLVDRYFFDYEVHTPHYVVVENHEEGNFLVGDPWQGKTLLKTPFQLQEAAFGMKYILGWAPIVVKIGQYPTPVK